METTAKVAAPGNALLRAFPSEIQQRLEIHEKQHSGHDVLIKAGDAPELVYFPHHGSVISLTRSAEGGATVEVGIVGWEGVVSVQSLLSPGPTGSDAIVQVAGVISHARLEDVQKLLNENPTVRALLFAAAGAFLTQVSQHVICNRLHSIEQRLAKWLLGVRDRTTSDQIDLTHDFLSHMLGTRRAGVTVAVGALELDGVVIHHRSRVTIVDRLGLEDRACECYAVLRHAIPLPDRD